MSGNTIFSILLFFVVLGGIVVWTWCVTQSEVVKPQQLYPKRRNRGRWRITLTLPNRTLSWNHRTKLGARIDAYRTWRLFSNHRSDSSTMVLEHLPKEG